MRNFILCCCLFFYALTAQALPKTYDNIVVSKSAQRGFDPLLIHAVIQTESGHNTYASNTICCSGLMQLHRSYFKGNLFDPDNNVTQGTNFLRQLLGQFGQNTVNALRAYNWGPGNMRSYLRGRTKILPKETQNYTKKIENYYYQYGGKGNFFTALGNGHSDSTVNPNNSTTDSALTPANTCSKMDLPEQPNITIREDDFPPLPPVTPVSTPDRTVFDPAKNEQLRIQIQSLLQQIAVLRGQYEAVTKSLAGIGLLSNITQLSGYVLPSALPTGQNEAQVFGAGGQGVYKSLVEQRAANTGVYQSSEIGKIQSQNAQIANHAYAEAEMAWTQASCSIQNLKQLVEIKTYTWKQSKDISNRIAYERANFALASAKIRANTTMMVSGEESYRLEVSQYLKKYLK